MHWMVLLVIIMSVQQCVSSMRTVIVRNHSSILVMEDSMVRLSCLTDKQWFFCLWNSPSLEQSCAIQYDTPTSVCSQTNRTTIIGQRMACDLEIKVTRDDHGNWMCLVNDNKEFNTIKEFISVSVGVIAETGVTVEGVEVHDGDVIEAVEGDSLDIQCYARNGYPGAEIEWSVPEDDNITSLSVSQAIHLSTTDHTVSVSRTARYTAYITNINRTINCIIRQVDNNNIISMQTITLALKIQEKRVAAPLLKKVPLLSGLLLLIIFLFLSCILMTMLLVRHRRKKRRRRELVSEDSQSSPLVLQVVKYGDTKMAHRSV